jgi:hypothetical protein
MYLYEAISGKKWDDTWHSKNAHIVMALLATGLFLLVVGQALYANWKQSYSRWKSRKPSVQERDTTENGSMEEPITNTTGTKTPQGGVIRNGLKTAEELGLRGTSLIIVRPIQKPPSQAVEDVASLESSEPEIK